MHWEGSNGETAENVMHFATEGNASDVGNGLAANFDDLGLIDTVSSAAGVTGFSVTPLDGVSPTTEFPFVSPFTGPGNDQFIPNLAAVITLYTARRGRSYRGRIFLPFTAENRQNNGFTDPSTVIGHLADAWTELAADLIALTPGVFPVVASYLHRTSEPVTLYKPQHVYGTQRRRQSRNRS